MIKDFKIFESKQELKVGDNVIIKYEDSKYFMQTGQVMSIEKTGDCNIRLDYTGDIVVFYKTNLIKIIGVVEIPSGQIRIMSYEDCVYLAAMNILTFNFDRGYYYYLSENKWEVQDYILL